MERLFRNYGLGIVLLALAVLSMVLQWHFTWDTVVADSVDQGNGIPSFYMIWSTYWANVFENLQSEFWQLFSFVVLASYLYWRGSPQSKDQQELTDRKLDAIRCEISAIRADLYKYEEQILKHRDFINHILSRGRHTEQP